MMQCYNKTMPSEKISPPVDSGAPTPPDCPAMEHMPLEAMEEIAAYFQVLAEPTRLQILNLLRSGERNISELAQLCGFTTANISRHLTMMSKHGLVKREGRGTSVFYRIADPTIYALCDLVCGNIARQLERSAASRAAFTGAPH